MISLFLALLVSTSAQSESRSGLVAEDHQHQWVHLVGEAGETSFLDVAYRDRADIEGSSYPVVLVRYLREESSAALADFRIAVDCESNAVSAIEAYLLSSEGEAKLVQLGKSGNLSVPSEAIHQENEARVTPLFQHACGADWTMKDAE